MDAEKRCKYSPKLKSKAARLMIDESSPIVEVARKIGTPLMGHSETGEQGPD